MKKLLLFSVMIALPAITSLVFSQDAEINPYIISVEPDSLMFNYDYSQTVFFTVSVRSRMASDPTEKAIQDLQTKIIETCKVNKMEAFYLQDIVFLKPFDEGKLIAYGTMFRAKVKMEE